ncbi:glycine zipper 2TM domain-containing protein [Verrucomicrobiaceae bacterium R5-34]|uniref:Glycine zipper 2TM domain-containing protein n=1 Tax=Oceaniferula flava TaxID=2800421 RepID=A0AAE2SAI0_9BACT|nr:glycine zipper domain-containing protein [Oceaniferula flavus]MBK1829131.1 glycine zipper 2TM domain-containing protein [Verrucomicrobiaceae bacterium R5-34]MBK1853367.1 glycine zipper 2TM domain-containing protein [Oceaniferula flavus]MBM1134672.1 glycine zipper 2TM domain-containing protein [Oceaniferula flavus]
MKTKTPKTRIAAGALFSAAALSFASCSNYDSHAKNDAATGALLGAAAGAAIGKDSGNTGTGAALGAAVGGGAGYAVGNEKDKRYYR